MSIDIFAVQAHKQYVDSKQSSKKKQNAIIGLFVLLIIVLFITAILLSKEAPSASPSLSTEVSFVTDAFEIIQEQYWQILSEQQLSAQFNEALSQTYGAQSELNPPTLELLQKRVDQLIRTNQETNHEEKLAEVVDLVVSNLQPAGRSRLYSQTQTQELKNLVENRDTAINLFEVLELSKDASDSAVNQAYQQKLTEVTNNATASSEQKKVELAQIERAYQSLNQAETRERYSENQIEPTISGKILSEGVFYLKITQFSPTTIQDLIIVLQKYNAEMVGPTLILDLRDNIGGAIDGLPYFLGPFIGQNRHAYQFFSRNVVEDFKTKIGWIPELVPYKRVVILVNEQTQSSAEVMAATLKKYGVGVIVGAPTRGWGTVERLFPINTELSSTTDYSLLLVHSLTLDENGEPIEGVGVKPDILISQADWKNQLVKYFNDQSLVSAVEELVK